MRNIELNFALVIYQSELQIEVSEVNKLRQRHDGRAGLKEEFKQLMVIKNGK